MDHQNNVYEDSKSVRISVDSFNMKIIKQQQRKQEQRPFKVFRKCHKGIQQMETYLFKKMN